ncbi:MAG: KpsF/GutQ family sugar-phosphate isomerase [Candidatus Omnitrophica bacterium]|nr:KpsF/GutQ family sugar-phosphate isomerase [Candidatus Omnitrophota bacterium]
MSAKKMSAVVGQGRAVLQMEADALLRLRRTLGSSFVKAVGMLEACQGRVVITGMGKPGFIAQKISATLASLGVPSLWLHPAEAAHGDLGRVTAQDVVVALSQSGETEELVHLVALVKRMGASIVVMTGNSHSRMTRHADVVLDVGVRTEAGPGGLVPTASTTAMLALGDALAIALAQARGFRKEDFARLHPGGNLGRRLLMTVKDLMRTGAAVAVATPASNVKQVLLAITQARAGSAMILDRRRRLLGIFTDGDLRRHLEEDPQLLLRPARQVMTQHPKSIGPELLAVEALKLLKNHRIDEMPVVDKQGKLVGLLDVQDLLKAGLV